MTFYLSNGVINRLQHAQDDLNKHLAGYLRATGRRRLLLPVALPGATFRGLPAGGHLAPDHADGTVTFEEYLAERIPARS